MIKGEYIFSRRDYWALMTVVFQPPLKVKLILLLIVMLYMIFMATLLRMHEGNSFLVSAWISVSSLIAGREHYSAYLAFVFVGLLVWFFNYLAACLRYLVLSSSAATSIGKVDFSLGTDFLEISDNKAETKIRWSTYKKLIATPDYLFLMVRFPLATMIPRHAFSTAKAFDDALAFIKSHVNKDTPIETR